MQSRGFSALPLIGFLAVIYFIARQTRFDAGVVARECIAGMAARGIALAGLLLLVIAVAGHLYRFAFWLTSRVREMGATSLAMPRQHARGVRGRLAGESIRRRHKCLDRLQGVFNLRFAGRDQHILSLLFGVTSLGVAGFADWALMARFG